MYPSSIITRTINLSSMRYARYAVGSDIDRQEFGWRNSMEEPLKRSECTLEEMSLCNDITLSIKGVRLECKFHLTQNKILCEQGDETE